MGGLSVNKDKLIGLFVLWGIILIIEILWFGTMRNSVHSTSDVVFAATVIGVTVVFGSVGLNLFKSVNREQK